MYLSQLYLPAKQSLNAIAFEWGFRFILVEHLRCFFPWVGMLSWVDPTRWGTWSELHPSSGFWVHIQKLNVKSICTYWIENGIPQYFTSFFFIHLLLIYLLLYKVGWSSSTQPQPMTPTRSTGVTQWPFNPSQLKINICSIC